MELFKTSAALKKMLDEFFDTIEEVVLIAKIAVDDYLSGQHIKFHENLLRVVELEHKADHIRRNIENRLYEKSLLPQFRGDLLHLLEKTDDIADILTSGLSQFEVEHPRFPEELHADLRRLTEMCVKSVEHLIPAERIYFRDPLSVKEMIHKVYFYEKESDQQALEIKRKIFNQIEDLDLSEKIHLRYFIIQIESISDTAETAANILSIMSIKRTL